MDAVLCSVLLVNMLIYLLDKTSQKFESPIFVAPWEKNFQ